MSWRARLSEWRYRHLLLLAGTLLFVLFEVLLVYHFKRSYVVDLGSPGDGAFVSNFYADEPDIGYRYRWSKDRSEISFLGAGNAKPQVITVWAQGPILPGPDASPIITFSASLNGAPPSAPLPYTLTDGMLPYTFDFASAQTPYTLTILASTFNAPGDSRTLGAKIDKATLLLSKDGLNLPPFDLLLWALLFFAGITGLIIPLRWGVSVWLLIIAANLFNLALTTLPHYIAAYLPTFAVLSALAGLLVWQRRRLPRWPFAANYSGTRPRFATWAMLAAMLIFSAIALWALPQAVWIGHADYAENANVARSLVEGRGLTVDYVAQFYVDHPGITHPAETWPLLQPLIIAPFFALFGPVTWAAKLPNLFVLLALAWMVFALASRLWDARAGLIAGLLTLFHPYFFNAILYPINDLVFTALFFALTWIVWHIAGNQRSEVRGQKAEGGEQSAIRNPQSAINKSKIQNPKSKILMGVLAALLVWSKPSGATLLVGLALWAFVVWWSAYRREKMALPWRSLLVMGGAFALVLAPLIIRSLLAFGKPYFSTESLDGWILRYWPYHEWEEIYKVYVGAADYPHPRWLVGGKFGYQNLFDAISINFRWVWERGVADPKGFKGSDYVIGPIPLLGAFVGLLVASRRVAALFGMVFLSITIYGLFVLLYWHFEGRYFQVAIPWLYMLLAWAIVWLWDTLRLRLRFIANKSAWLAWVVPMLTTVALLLPSFSELKDYLTYDTRPTSFTVAMDWLSRNSTPADVVMTRDPWELNWHTRRKAMMIPFEDLTTIKQIATQYGATMLQLGGPADGINIAACPPDNDAMARYPTGSRPALGKLYCGYELPGFTRVYQNGDLVIYRINK